MRLGESRARGAAVWTSSNAHLGIIRADLHVVKAELPREGRVIAFTHFAVIRECVRLARRRPGPQVIGYCEVLRVELGK